MTLAYISVQVLLVHKKPCHALLTVISKQAQIHVLSGHSHAVDDCFLALGIHILGPSQKLTTSTVTRIEVCII